MPEILSLISLVVGVFGIIFAVRKFLQIFRPIHVKAGVKLMFDNSGPDEIQAKILNKSRETQYVVRCVARSTFPLRTIIWKHLKNPIVSPRLYPTIRYSGISFDLLGTNQIKLEPFESIELTYKLSSHSLNLFLTPILQVEVELSTRRVFQSSRVPVPKRWRFKGKKI